jgi:hypothetical protein
MVLLTIAMMNRLSAETLGIIAGRTAARKLTIGV